MSIATTIDQQANRAIAPVYDANTMPSITHKFAVGRFEFYLTIGMTDAGQLRYASCKGQKNGTVIQGMMTTICSLMTVCFEMGASAAQVAEALENHPFEPNGATDNPEIPTATSLANYIAEWLRMNYVKGAAK